MEKKRNTVCLVSTTDKLDIGVRTEEVLNRVTHEIVVALAESLPKLSHDWWDRYVIQQLTPNQQRFLRNKAPKLNSLDLSAAIRVFTRNFMVISDVRGLSQDCKYFAFQVLDIRNRHAHRTTEAVRAEDNYRDLDTIVRFLQLLKADPLTVDVIQEVKRSALNALAPPYTSNNEERRPAQSSVAAKDKCQIPMDKKKKRLKDDSVKLSKQEALALVSSRTGQIMKPSWVTFSNLNRATGNWWFEVSKVGWSKERFIILNDHNNKILYLFKIPANSFVPAGNFFYIRPDKGRSSIYVDPNDAPVFRDIHPSGPGRVRFGDYLIDSIKY